MIRQLSLTKKSVTNFFHNFANCSLFWFFARFNSSRWNNPPTRMPRA